MLRLSGCTVARRVGCTLSHTTEYIMQEVLSPPMGVRLLVALLWLLAGSSSAAQAGPPIPDGVCYPVKGTGYAVTRADGRTGEIRIPIGTLSPLVEGDSLVVETGTITFLDFRNGQSSVYGAGTRLTIPAVIDPHHPSWWERLVDLIVRSMSEPERSRIDRISGSVRHGRPAFWPEGGRFAPEVPIVFKWWRVHPAPARLRIHAGRTVTELEISGERTDTGALAWKPATAPSPGTVSWLLLDQEGNSTDGGEFVILTAKEAESQRQRFRKAAGSIDAMPKDLAAAVMAAADSAYLW